MFKEPRNEPNADGKRISVQEAADIAGVSAATIRNWIKTGEIKNAADGRLSPDSLRALLLGADEKNRLRSRANKSLKDGHSHSGLQKSILSRADTEDPCVLSGEYEAALSNSYKNKEGLYYTPCETAADMLADISGAVHNASFCDPCCGSGNFLIEALNRGFSAENVYGFDTDPVAVQLARGRIRRLFGIEEPNVYTADFLESSAEHEQKFDYIFTNPPWGKKLSRKEKNLYALQFNCASASDSSVLFFFASLNALNEGGLMGFLLPQSFFNISAFEAARKKALEYNILRMKDYGKLFDGLITRAQSIVLKKEASSNSNVRCCMSNTEHLRCPSSFKENPKHIFNFDCSEDEAAVISRFFSKPYIRLEGNARWGLGIVTGNNEKHCSCEALPGYVPVYRGCDISPDGIADAGLYISSDMSRYQQCAPNELYNAKEKLIYKFISSRLCFFHDTKQRYFLNSANMLVLDEGFPISASMLKDVLNSSVMNMLFAKLFATHKVLRKDLESLPIHADFFKGQSVFDEGEYLKYLGIRKEGGGYILAR